MWGWALLRHDDLHIGWILNDWCLSFKRSVHDLIVQHGQLITDVHQLRENIILFHNVSVHCKQFPHVSAGSSRHMCRSRRLQGSSKHALQSCGHWWSYTSDWTIHTHPIGMLAHQYFQHLFVSRMSNLFIFQILALHKHNQECVSLHCTYYDTFFTLLRRRCFWVILCILN